MEAKVVLLGAASVGKTSIVLRLMEDRFETDQASTVGASFSSKLIVVGEYQITLRIWDTAGQERFRSIAPMYYQGASVALIVFGLDSYDSFEGANGWIDELTKQLEDPIQLYLIGNKSDLDKKTVPNSEAEKKANSINATYFEVSAKTGYNINELFQHVSDYLIRAKKNEASEEVGGVAINEQNSLQKTKSKKCSKC